MAVGLEIYNSSGTKVWDNTKTTLFYAYAGTVPTNTTTSYNTSTWPTYGRLHIPILNFDDYVGINSNVNLHGAISLNTSWDGVTVTLSPQSLHSDVSGWTYYTIPGTMRLDVFIA